MKTRTLKEAYRNWISALRSGKYKQTKSRLKDFEGHCCLGVLCELRVLDGFGEITLDAKAERYEFDFGDRTGPAVAALSLTFRNNMRMTYDEMWSLAHMNDEGKSFKHIADEIEKEIMPKALKRESKGEYGEGEYGE